MLVSKSDVGPVRVMVLDDGKAFSFKDGSWVPKLLFSADELAEDFVRVEDPTEIAFWANEARLGLEALNIEAKKEGK